MTLLEVPTGSKNAPNRFPVEFYPKRYVRLPFSQKIFSENRKKRKNLPGRLRNPSRKKNRDLNRISLTLSNRDSLVSAYSPTLTNRCRLRYIRTIELPIYIYELEIVTPHILQFFFGPPFFNFPPYFFKVADLRFNTFLDTERAISRCWRALRRLRALTMLPIDSPSNSTLNGMFAPHFRKRSLTKIEKIEKISPVAYEIQAGKKIAT